MLYFGCGLLLEFITKGFISDWCSQDAYACIFSVLLPKVLVIHVSISLCDGGKKGSGEGPLVDMRKLHFWRLRLSPKGGP